MPVLKVNLTSSKADAGHHSSSILSKESENFIY